MKFGKYIEFLRGFTDVELWSPSGLTEAIV